MTKPADLPMPKPSPTVLAELPGRALTFLIAIATRAPIREQMEAGGYRAEDHAEGWALLGALGQYPVARQHQSSRDRAQAAMNELTAWAHKHFGRFEAAVRRLHPASVGLFPAISARPTGDALIHVAHLLEALRREPTQQSQAAHQRTGDRKDSAAGAAQEAAPTLRVVLERRGLDPPTIARLDELLADAQQLEQGSDENPEHAPRTEALLRLHDWYRDWAETARRLVVRRDHQISLGIAGRRRKDRSVDERDSRLFDRPAPSSRGPKALC